MTPSQRPLCRRGGGAHHAGMHRSSSALAFAPRAVAVLALALAGSAQAQGTDVTIYRCTDARGALSLQDAPCAGDQSQQTRTMLRPKDGAPLPAAPRPATVTPAPSPQIVVINAPRPLYECVRDDGSRYTSDSGDGNPRYIDGGGYDDVPSRNPIAGGAAAGTGPGVAGPRYGMGRNGSAGAGFTSVTPPLVGIPQGNTQRTLPSRPPRGDRGGRGYGYGFAYGGGSVLVRDACSALPQAEVCDRIRDRREDIRGRFFNAQANERATLGLEERGINARLAADCGGA